MDRFYYAIIDQDGICTGLIDTPSEMQLDNYIQIDTYDESCMGKLWNGSTWEEVVVEMVQEEPVPELE